MIVLSALGSAGFRPVLLPSACADQAGRDFRCSPRSNVAVFRAFRARALPRAQRAIAAITVVVGAILVVARNRRRSVGRHGPWSTICSVLISSLCWTSTIKAQTMVGYSALRPDGAHLFARRAGRPGARLRRATHCAWRIPPVFGDFIEIGRELSTCSCLVSAVSASPGTSPLLVGALGSTLPHLHASHPVRLGMVERSWFSAGGNCRRADDHRRSRLISTKQHQGADAMVARPQDEIVET